MSNGEYSFYNDEFVEEIYLVKFGATAVKLPEMVSRPFELYEERDEDGGLIRNYMDEINFNGLNEDLELSSTGEIGPSLIGKHLKKAIRPKRRSYKLHLPNGWKEKRLSYMLVLATPRTGGELLTFIQGYTDKYEVDYRYKELVDDTIFYINRITLINKVEDDYGEISHTFIGSYEVIYNKHSGNYEYRDEENDVPLNKLSRAADINIDITAGKMNYRSKIINAVNTLDGEEGKINNVSQKTANGLLSDIINAYNITMDENHPEDINTMFTTNSLLATPDATSIPFIVALDALRDNIRNSISSAPTYFTYKELREIVPEISDDSSVIVESDDDKIAEIQDEFDVEDDSMAEDPIRREDDAVILVTELYNHILDKMSKHGVKSASFYVHNLDGEVKIDRIKRNSFTFAIPGLPRRLKRIRRQKFLREIRDEWFLQASEFGHRKIFAKAIIFEDFDGRILIEGDGIYPRTYPVSTSMSSIITPILTNDRGFRSLRNGVMNIIGNLE